MYVYNIHNQNPPFSYFNVMLGISFLQSAYLKITDRTIYTHTTHTTKFHLYVCIHHRYCSTLILQKFHATMAHRIPSLYIYIHHIHFMFCITCIQHKSTTFIYIKFIIYIYIYNRYCSAPHLSKCSRYNGSQNTFSLSIYIIYILRAYVIHACNTNPQHLSILDPSCIYIYIHIYIQLVLLSTSSFKEFTLEWLTEHLLFVYTSFFF